MARTTITSLHNPRVREAVRLRKAVRRKAADEIIVEGYREIGLAAETGLIVTTLFFARELARKEHDPDKIMATDTLNVTPEVFAKLSWREHPDGFLALARPRYRALADIRLPAQDALLLVIESVEKPGNLGAILRSADAARADAVLVADPATDIYNPNVIRASLGTVFTNQVAISSTAEALEFLKKHGIRTLAATPHTATVYTDADYSGSIALLIGTEHEGLSETWLKAADEKIKIPMRGRIDSLNASVSAAVILFEALRQRQSD